MDISEPWQGLPMDGGPRLPSKPPAGPQQDSLPPILQPGPHLSGVHKGCLQQVSDV